MNDGICRSRGEKKRYGPSCGPHNTYAVQATLYVWRAGLSSHSCRPLSRANRFHSALPQSVRAVRP